MPRVKKAEREAVAAALQQDHDSVDEAAEAAIRAVDEQRAEYLSKPQNRPYVILAQAHPGLVYSFGPYPTEAQAKRALKGLVSPGPEPMMARVQRLMEVTDA